MPQGLSFNLESIKLISKSEIKRVMNRVAGFNCQLNARLNL